MEVQDPQGCGNLQDAYLLGEALLHGTARGRQHRSSSAAPSVLPDSPPTVHAALKGSPLVPPQASPTPRTHRLLSSSREGSATLSLLLFQESAPLCLRRLVSLTFLLVTMQMMIINSRICSGNNTRYSVIYHLEVSWLWGGYCISSCTRQVRCRH